LGGNGLDAGRLTRQAIRHQVTDVDANRALEWPARRAHLSIDPVKPAVLEVKRYALPATAYHPRRVMQSPAADR
jgi:hypothetical protein